MAKFAKSPLDWLLAGALLTGLVAWGWGDSRKKPLRVGKETPYDGQPVNDVHWNQNDTRFLSGTSHDGKQLVGIPSNGTVHWSVTGSERPQTSFDVRIR